jgi:hypothetical protein
MGPSALPVQAICGLTSITTQREKAEMTTKLMKAAAMLIAVAGSVFVLGGGVAKADCQTDCYDSGNTGEHCVTTCN